MDSKNALREALIYLDAVRGYYPFGIPRAENLIESVASKLVTFIGDLSGSGMALLESAIERGMKLKLEAVGLVDTKGGAINLSHLQEAPAQVLILLGDKIDKSLRPKFVAQGPSSQCCRFENSAVLISQELELVAKDAAAKKLFWQDLKQAMLFFKS